MTLRIKYSHLADYVSLGANGKPVVVGIFDRVIAPSNSKAPYRIPMSYLIVSLEGSVVDAGKHEIGITLFDGNRTPITEPILFTGELRPTGVGRPVASNLIAFLANLVVPEFGDYEFVVRSDRSGEIGVVSFSVVSESDVV